MQDLKLNGIYIAIGHSSKHNIVKFEVLEITKTSYFIHWLDVNQKGRYDKEQFAFDYRIVETIKEPEPTTNYLAKNFLGIKEEKSTQETAVLLGPKSLTERYKSGEFLNKTFDVLYSIAYITSTYKNQQDSTLTIKNSLYFAEINKELEIWLYKNKNKNILEENLTEAELKDEYEDFIYTDEQEFLAIYYFCSLIDDIVSYAILYKSKLI